MRDSTSIKITVDSHEPGYILALLIQRGVDVERKTITPGDYVLSSECAIERKTVGDFLNSIYSGRLFEQVDSLKEAYLKPIVILEGDVGLELELIKNPRAFWGAILRVEVDMDVPIITTPTFFQTVDVLCTLANRLQRNEKNKISIQHKPRLMTEKDWQVYIVAGLPNIGNQLATRLLKHFKTIRNVFQAKMYDFERVKGIGRARAKKITKLLDQKYFEE